jgi:hypothetical protein
MAIPGVLCMIPKVNENPPEVIIINDIKFQQDQVNRKVVMEDFSTDKAWCILSLFLRVSESTRDARVDICPTKGGKSPEASQNVGSQKLSLLISWCIGHCLCSRNCQAWYCASAPTVLSKSCIVQALKAVLHDFACNNFQKYIRLLYEFFQNCVGVERWYAERNNILRMKCL